MRDNKYKKFTQANFGSWEEVKITELLGSMVTLCEFPLLEVPFYHAKVPKKEPTVANNADIIWPGYREIMGSGQRIASLKELEKKAQIFNLPKEDYAPYIKIRTLSDYERTSGFGMGLERLIQGLLKMPYIWSAVQFPRVHNSLVP